MLLRAKILLALGVAFIGVAAYGQSRSGLVLLTADERRTSVLEPASLSEGQVAVHHVFAQPMQTAWGAARADREVIAVDCARSMSRTTRLDMHSEDGGLLHSETVQAAWAAPNDYSRRDAIRFVCDADFAKAARRTGTEKVTEIKRRYLAALRTRA